jgi:peptidoglycan/xylan/chitin deacetylase (PgdA/CDA1 family)
MSKVFPLWVKTPRVIRALMPDVLWQMPTKEKILYLTFDDGPVLEATPFVLEQLEKYNAKATFFCIGDNVRKHPDIFQQVINAGHTVANHTMHHISGWEISEETYLDEVSKCDEILGWTLDKQRSKLFRPPYGKLKPSQHRKLKDKYQIVLWDVLSYDFDLNLSGETVADNVIQNVEAGSIVVLHDSVKAFPRLQTALPKILQYYAERGWEFACIV